MVGDYRASAEIRNPLTSIKMLIQVNRAKFADEGLPTDDLEIWSRSSKRFAGWNGPSTACSITLDPKKANFQSLRYRTLFGEQFN